MFLTAALHDRTGHMRPEYFSSTPQGATGVDRASPERAMSCQPAEPVIAIVDDEAPVRTGLARLMRSRGYQVAGYASGTDFLRSLDSSRPDCVLLDLHMPVLSGCEVLAALRKRSESIPVIVVTGNADADIPQKVTALGAMSCLNKPVDAPTLFDAIDSALRVTEAK
jgi:FixJ family two-component response regulator